MKAIHLMELFDIRHAFYLNYKISNILNCWKINSYWNKLKNSIHAQTVSIAVHLVAICYRNKCCFCLNLTKNKKAWSIHARYSIWYCWIKIRHSTEKLKIYVLPSELIFNLILLIAFSDKLRWNFFLKYFKLSIYKHQIEERKYIWIFRMRWTVD